MSAESQSSPVDREAVQRAIDRRRAESEARFRAVMASQSALPELSFSEARPEEIEAVMRSAGRFTLVVSFHTRAYFLLLLLLAKAAVKCTAVTTPGLAKRFQENRLVAPPNVDFVSSLTPARLKSCLAERRGLFIMADVLIPYGANAPLPVLGRAISYTTSWAELATTLRLNVVVGLVKDRGSQADVFLKHLGVPDGSAYDLAEQVCGLFSDYLGNETDLWENYPALEAYGLPLPDCRSGASPELLKMLARFGMCDLNTARALREGLRELRA